MPEVKQRFTKKMLTAVLSTYLGAGEASIIWADRGDEVIIHASQIKVYIQADGLIVTVPMESRETKRAVMTVVLALASVEESPNLLAVTDAQPRGNPVIAARWGAALQDAVWGSLLELFLDHVADPAKLIGVRLNRGKVELVAMQ